MQSHRSSHHKIPHSRSSTSYANGLAPPTTSSIISTIKNFVTAPISWLTGNNEFEDTPGKRRRVYVPESPRNSQQETRTAKRQRVRSPSPMTPGYNDPPSSLFPSLSKLESFSPMRFSPVPVSVTIQQQQPGRSLNATHLQNEIPRVMSIGPSHQQPSTKDPTLVPLPQSREQSALSVSRDHSPAPSPFRMRTTLTPLPSGIEYGPKPQRRQRDPSEPPPLTALMSNPIFVKPPQDSRLVQRSLSAQPTTVTLDALAQNRRRTTRSPLRHSSGVLFGSSLSSDALSPVNASEIALSELAIYRTPLLPTRLRGSSAIPDMFKRKRVHQIVPMRNGKGELPRLGTGDKKKKRFPKDDGGKPYTGQGGMKKLLARRKLEVEEGQVNVKEGERPQFEVSVAENVNSDAPKAVEVIENASSLPASITPILEPVVQQHRVNGREHSSLRVGRTRISRQHLERVASSRPSKNTFSAIYEEDDSMDQTGDIGEALKPVPVFEAPKGFTFAPEVPPTQPSLKDGDAKEPPIAALPFCLTKGSPSPDLTISVASPPSAPPPPASTQTISSLASGVPSTPTISFIPPTPEAVSKKRDVSAPIPTIPNFFANSPLLNKSISTPRPPSVTNLLGLSPSPDKCESAIPEIEAPTPSAFSDVGKPSSDKPTIFGFPTSLDGKLKSPTPAPLSGPTFTQSADPTITSSTSLTVTAQSKPLFDSLTPQSAGQPSLGGFDSQPAAKNPQKATVPTSSLYGSGETTSFTGFGSAEKSSISKPSLSFGQPILSSALNLEPSKSLFVSSLGATGDAKDVSKPAFSFGSNPATPQNTPSKLSSDAPPATPPPEKQYPSLFGGISSTPIPPPSSVSNSSSNAIFSFGATSAATTDSSTSFFGNKISRPITPKNDQEVRMEESPTRSMDIIEKNSNNFFAPQDAGNARSSTPFIFGASTNGSNSFSSKPEEKGQPKPTSNEFAFGSSGGSGFGSFGQKQPEASQPTFSQPTPFSFGKSEGNGRQTSTSPFAFGAQKLPEINTNITPQTSGGFTFGQGPGSSQGTTTSFNFGQQPSTTTNPSQFSFGSSGQGAATNAFGQQNASAPSSPSTFGQPSPFGFGGSTTSSTGPSNPFNFQAGSPVTNAAPSGAFSFGQSTAVQAPQSPAPPFGTPSSPQTGGTLFTIGAAPNSRQIKKLPTRRGGKR